MSPPSGWDRDGGVWNSYQKKQMKDQQQQQQQSWSTANGNHHHRQYQGQYQDGSREIRQRPLQREETRGQRSMTKMQKKRPQMTAKKPGPPDELAGGAAIGDYSSNIHAPGIEERGRALQRSKENGEQRMPSANSSNIRGSGGRFSRYHGQQQPTKIVTTNGNLMKRKPQATSRSPQENITQTQESIKDLKSKLQEVKDNLAYLDGQKVRDFL